MSIKDWVKFIILGLIWGSSFLWIKIGLQELQPMTLVAIRVAFAVLALLVIIILAKKYQFNNKYLWPFIFLGLLNTAMPFALITWSEKYITSGLASILNSTSPLWTIALAPIFLADEAITRQRLVGLLAGFFGVIVLMFNQLGTVKGAGLGVLAMLVATFFYACGAIFVRINKAKMPSEMQAFGQFLIATLFMFPVAAIFEAPLKIPVLPLTWFALAFLGVLGSCIATLMYFSLIKSVGPTRALLVTYIFPLVGVILGAVFLDEKVGFTMILGGLLILAGIWVVNQGFRLPFVKAGGFAWKK